MVHYFHFLNNILLHYCFDWSLLPGPTKRICPSDLTFSAQMCLPFVLAETTPFEVLYFTILLYFTHSNARLVFPLSDQLWTSISQGQVKIFKNFFLLLKDLSKISPMCLPVGLCPSDRRSYGPVFIGLRERERVGLFSVIYMAIVDGITQVTM